MAKYLVRVVLHNANWETYDKFHETMRLNGFVRQVVGGDGKIFNLPDAEYIAIKNEYIDNVRDKVIKFAAMYVQKYDVLVSEVLGMSWYLN
ncbi:hypothetical protein [Rosenbergiella epipactidis]|uniref:hypothetical protein n=1 Tax=Rosenbergiella epipactidis TaxID=1544694 RepID=UPI001F4D6AB8|nr:hypothetical protein [Rosenbergiella epipactidis]